MTPDEIRRSWDDDDTPRSVFPEPLAERLTRENKELRARHDALVADLRGLTDDLDSATPAPKGSMFFDAPSTTRLRAREAVRKTVSMRLRAVLDKHAGEQP